MKAIEAIDLEQVPLREAAEELEALLRDWDVTVTGRMDEYGGKPWCVRIVSRRTGRAHMVRGATADEAIHRAWMGEVDND